MKKLDNNFIAYLVLVFVSLMALEGCAEEIPTTSVMFQAVCDVGIASVAVEMAKKGYEEEDLLQCTKIIEEKDRYIVFGSGWYIHSAMKLKTFKDWTVTLKKTKSTPTLRDTSNSFSTVKF